MGSTWVNALLAGIGLGAGAVFLLAAARRPAQRPGCLAHALMGLGMAGMFSPWGDPVPPVAGALVFVVVAAWFAAALLRTGRVGLTESTHLVVGPAAMVLMYLVPMGHAPTDTTVVDPAHAGHTMTMGGGGGSPWLSAVALGLTGYFVWYAWILAGRLRPAAPTASGGGTVAVAAPALATGTRIVVGAHVVMCGLMAVMFLGSV
ncbi:MULTISPECIES: DUF5134 domain-containing protein [unclassified Pseudonocardia]|jgi:hypothetical protein|uniref:DUF5134 domain-containing protein n=1 Tax=unclassified Pseudonocardia TaxID=2619320 RepID=UPI001AD42AA6|nr:MULTISPECIES: DUF5134 domain-containing protein [unclassified Pseudonocardia]MBN9098594.1 DUF5134 domain-containing protein [Pseudonocardia sp.]